MCGFPGAYFCIKAFSETDLTEDLKKIDVPTLILHGAGDQIVPIDDSARLSARIVKGSIWKVIPGAAIKFPSGHWLMEEKPVRHQPL
jgi:non-heme chloroperoxidase